MKYPPSPMSETRWVTSSVLSMLHVWLLLIFFGAILFDTLVLYPNIFHNVPESLRQASFFLTQASPGSFFPKLGMCTIASGVCRIIAIWPLKAVRIWVISSIFLMIAGELVFSIVYFWPRNTMMFVEGTRVHTPAELIKVATDFQKMHWVRVGMSGLTGILSFIGFLIYYRMRMYVILVPFFRTNGYDA